MKNLIIFLCFLSIFSCKKPQENINTVSKEVVLKKEWQGDLLISDFNFVNSIDKTCKLNSAFFGRSDKKMKDDNLKCTLSKIKFDYEKLNSIKTKFSIGNINATTELFIKSTKPSNIENADIYNQATLYIELNKKITDSIVIYHSINFSEALTVKERNYYIDRDYIYLLDLVEDESGTNVEKWTENKVDKSGKINLVKHKIFSAKNLDNVAKSNDDLWNGIYYFEASNKDNIKTIFNITINSLENVSLDVTEEGIKSKYYKIKAEKIDNEKIRINYDSSSDDMGEIYIEKSDDKFYISGNPIYYINPGNNEMPLKKVK